MVSVDPSDKTSIDLITKEHVLDLCNNFVVFDEQLNTFRFAHLSVREFLENRLDILAANRLVAEVCLWSVLSAEDEAATTDLLRQLKLRAGHVSTSGDMSRATPSKIIFRYAVVSWTTHCKLAGDCRESPDGTLKPLLRHMLSHEPSFMRWNDQLLELIDFKFPNREIQSELFDKITIPISRNDGTRSGRSSNHFLRHRLRNQDSFRMSILEVCCVFNFREQLELVLGDQMPGHQRSLQLAAKYGNSATLQQLLMTKHFINMEISSVVIRAAAKNSHNAEELITLLFSHPGGTAAISELDLSAAAYNTVSGEAVMPLLLRQLRRDMAITPESVEAAAGNPAYGYHVMQFLLDQLEANFTVTLDMVEAAQRNTRNSNGVLQILLDKAGEDMPVSLEIVKKAAGNRRIKKEVMLCLLDQLGEDTPITLEIVMEAAGNQRNEKEVMLRLLDRLEAGASITNDFTRTIVQRYDADVIAFLLDQRGADVKITKFVMQAAVDINHELVQSRLAVLLKWLAQAGAPIPVDLTATIFQTFDEKEIAFLFDQPGVELPIVEEVVTATVHGSRTEARRKLALLFERQEQEMHEVLARLAGVVGVGVFEELNVRRARVKCGDGWIYLRRDEISGVLSV